MSIRIKGKKSLVFIQFFKRVLQVIVKLNCSAKKTYSDKILSLPFVIMPKFEVHIYRHKKIDDKKCVIEEIIA